MTGGGSGLVTAAPGTNHTRVLNADRDVKFVFFQIRTLFLKFEFYSNFVQAHSKN